MRLGDEGRAPVEVIPTGSIALDIALSGDVPGVCFPCGAVADGDRVRLYYGAADTCLAMAEGSISQIVEHLLECPAE